jgi:hypothetical protein
MGRPPSDSSSSTVASAISYQQSTSAYKMAAAAVTLPGTPGSVSGPGRTTPLRPGVAFASFPPRRQSSPVDEATAANAAHRSTMTIPGFARAGLLCMHMGMHLLLSWHAGLATSENSQLDIRFACVQLGSRCWRQRSGTQHSSAWFRLRGGRSDSICECFTTAAGLEHI